MRTGELVRPWIRDAPDAIRSDSAITPISAPQNAASGHELRGHIEAGTDELPFAPYAALGDDSVAALLRHLGPPARQVARAGEIQFPNPMGLPAMAAPG